MTDVAHLNDNFGDDIHIFSLTKYILRPDKKYYVVPVTNDPPKIGSVGRKIIFFIKILFW